MELSPSYRPLCKTKISSFFTSLLKSPNKPIYPENGRVTLKFPNFKISKSTYPTIWVPIERYDNSLVLFKISLMLILSIKVVLTPS